MLTWFGFFLNAIFITAPAPPEAFVRQHNGTPTLFINGQPHPGISYMTYRPDAKNFRAMGNIGVHLYSFSATPTDSTYNLAPPIWLGPDQFDFSSFDARVKLLLDADPAAYFFPRLFLGTPPWWADLHPDDLVRYDPQDGKPENDSPNSDNSIILKIRGKRVASWASQTWREQTAQALRRFIQHVESSPYADRVLGYHLASGTTEEWMQWGSNEDQWADYSPVNTTKFRQWLTKKYQTDEKIRTAWNNQSISLTTADIPSRRERAAAERDYLRDPQVAQSSIDYTQYTSWLVADTIRYFAAEVKKSVQRKRLVGVFYGYVLQLAGATREQISGHHAFQDILRCPDIDFITSPTSYAGRDLESGFPHAMSLIDSIKLHGKLWFDENDFRTYLAKNVPPNFPGYTKTVETTLLSQRRSFAWTLTNRLGMWWFDMGGGWYDDPRLLAEFEKMNHIAHTNIDVAGKSVAQIAFVVDDNTAAYLSTSNPFSYSALVRQLQELGHIGAPFDTVHVADLDQLPDYRLYIFPNLLAPREADRQRIKQKLARGGSVLWIGPAGLYRNGQMADENMQDLTGFSLHFAKSAATWKITPTSEAQSWGWKNPAPFSCGGSPHIVPIASKNDGQVLGHIANTQLPALVVKSHNDRLSVFSSIPMLPASLLRSIAEKAGVHCYSITGDIVWASNNHLAVHANQAGPRTIHLPQPHRIKNLWNDKILQQNSNRLEANLNKHETLLLRLD